MAIRPDPSMTVQPERRYLTGLAGEAAATRGARPRATVPTSPAPLQPATTGGRGEMIRPNSGGAYFDNMHARGPNDPTPDPNNAGFDINTGGGGGGGSSMAVSPVERREVQAGELVENRLAGLLRSDSALSRMADIRGRREASRMGSSAGSYYGGAAQLAAQDIMLPVAQQDAAWVGRTASDNMNAQNERGNNELSAASSANVANIGAGASMFNARLDASTARDRMALDRELSAEDRRLTQEGWRFEEGANERSDLRREGIDTRSDARRHDYNKEEAALRFGYDMTAENYRARNAARDYAYRGVVDGMIDNPEEWDQGVADGMFEYFGEQSDEMYDDVYNDVFGTANRRAARRP